MKFDISHWRDGYLTWNIIERDNLKRLIVYWKTTVHNLEVTSAHGCVRELRVLYMLETLCSERPLGLEGCSREEICKHQPTNQKVALLTGEWRRGQRRLSEYLDQIPNCILATFVLMWPKFLAEATYMRKSLCWLMFQRGCTPFW